MIAVQDELYQQINGQSLCEILLGAGTANHEALSMTVWTIQTVPAWERFQELGILRADATYIDPDFLAAYRWLVGQMILRVGLAPVGVEFPIWVWYQYSSAALKRPDLRQAGHLPRGERGVLLECDCPAHTLLLSDFVLWHHVLNNWYLPTDEADEQAFEGHAAVSTAVEEVQRQKSASWPRIFDLDWHDPQEQYTSTRPYKAIQGTIWEIHLNQIKSVKVFVAR